MSMHSGRISSGPVRTSLEITTTLYELMEVLGERVSSVLETLTPGQAQDSLIAGRISRMLSSGRIRFKHPQVIWKTCPEWCR